MMRAFSWSRSTRWKSAFAQQVRALIAGGVDLLLVETDLRFAERQGGACCDS